MKLLDRKQHAAIVQALEIAAKVFAEDEQKMRDEAQAYKTRNADAPAAIAREGRIGFERVADQFAAQRTLADELATLMQDYDGTALIYDADIVTLARVSR
jgi:hypothetical protein